MAFGAACRVALADKAPAELLLCDDDFGESFAMERAGFVDKPEWMAAFVRRTCF